MCWLIPVKSDSSLDLPLANTNRPSLLPSPAETEAPWTRKGNPVEPLLLYKRKNPDWTAKLWMVAWLLAAWVQESDNLKNISIVALDLSSIPQPLCRWTIHWYFGDTIFRLWICWGCTQTHFLTPLRRNHGSHRLGLDRSFERSEADAVWHPQPWWSCMLSLINFSQILHAIESQSPVPFN